MKKYETAHCHKQQCGYCFKLNQGITLIALVLTIIVMLIIAGVAISAISIGGIPFGKMKEATDKYNQASQDEANRMNEIYRSLEEINSLTPNIDTSKAVETNPPVLVKGMTPIVWDESSKAWQETTENAKWYSYEEQTGTTERPGSGTSKWANVKMPDGSMFVWIPRYAYKIKNSYHTGGENIQGTMDVKFIKQTTYIAYDGTECGDSSTKPVYSEGEQINWIVHPVFRSNTDIGGWTSELPGIWVAKFEASNTLGYGDESTANNINLTLQVLPNKLSWRNIEADNIFIVCQTANYGYSTKPNTIDSHMMKNTEWGAVAYLSHSKYGRNGTEISINNASGTNSSLFVKQHTTGYSAGTNISGDENTDTYFYADENGQLASTTGNIYGIYDMSGGAWEYLASHYNQINDNSYINNIINAKPEYKNVYTNYSEEKFGDAVYETSSSIETPSHYSWFYDYSFYINADRAIFVRGGRYNSKELAGLFCFNSGTGQNGLVNGFRPTIVVQNV